MTMFTALNLKNVGLYFSKCTADLFDAESVIDTFWEIHRYMYHRWLLLM